MDSKEKLQRSINALNYKKSQNGKLSNVDEERLKCYEEVFKDLEDYEELKKIMGTPIQDIMKRLKLLDILKEFLSDANTGTGWIEINIDPNHDNLDSEEYKKKKLLIKEWLKNE